MTRVTAPLRTLGTSCVLVGLLYPELATAAPAPELDRDYSGPVDPGAGGGQTPPATAPVVPVEPADEAAPPSTAAPAPTPAEPAPVDPEPPTDDDEGGGGFEVVDLTEDEEALAKELQVETKQVKGEAGTVTGRVLDSTTGKPMIGAYVEAIGTEYKTKTDLEGNYTLPLPPGTYELRIRYDTFEPRRVSGVVVAANATQSINGELKPLAGASQTVVVAAPLNKESAGARMQQRKEAVASNDVMSREDIQRSGGGATSSVARRIVAATIVDGRFLFVRGLGHRYGNTLLDGARVPSPEPELRTVPLDIFPSGALSAINVQKTFTPDVPVDFVGGSTQLETRAVPDEFVLDVGAWIGANTATTGRERVWNNGFGGYDAFGYGNIPRALPSAIPDDLPVQRGLLEEGSLDTDDLVYSADDIERLGESMNTDFEVLRNRKALPNFGANATIGYGDSLKGGGKLGFLLSGGYANRLQTYREKILFYGLGANGELQVDAPQTDFEGDRTVQEVGWNTLGLLKWEANKQHSLALTAFYSHEGEDETREYRGIALSVSNDPNIQTRLRYVARSVLFTRLGGKHEFPAAKGLVFDWFGSFAQAERDDPSMRDNVFTLSSSQDEYQIDLGSNAAKILFFHLLDNNENGALNLTMPFEQWGRLASKFKIGAWVEGKQREFDARRFIYRLANGLRDQVPGGTGDIINDSTIGGGTSALNGGTEPFYIDENTLPTDNYRATMELYAGYGLLELPIVRWFKIAGGVRYEYSDIVSTPYNLFDPDDPQTKALESRLVNSSFLPALSFIFAPTQKMNVRLSGSQTIARPEFRELAPFRFQDFVGGVTAIGNPNIRSTFVWNADLRWEWFPTGNEVIAASAFYKYFDEPIERVMGATIPLNVTFRNADFAQNVGGEFELRKNLEFMGRVGSGASDQRKERAKRARRVLADFSVGANVALIWSQVRLPPAQSCDVSDDSDCVFDLSTNRVRPLQGQSPYVVNTYVAYDNRSTATSVRLLFNTFGPRISEVGTQGQPDTYEQPIHGLDFALRQTIHKGFYGTFGAQNLLNWPTRFLQGDALRYEVKMGTSFTVGLGFEL